MARRVAIVDDHPLLRRGLTALLADEPDLAICGEATDTAGAMALIESTRPDLAIVDISLEHGGGLDLIKRMRSRFPQTRALVLSMHEESLYAERALHAGAMGYVHTEAAPECVLEAVRRILAGHVYLSPQMTEHFLRQMVDGTTLQKPAESNLSDRELEVYELIGEGLTTREIATRLRLSVKTIETHRDHIRGKLNLKNATELTHRATQWRLENR